MTTQELITFIESRTREARPVILSLLNEIQKFIYMKPMEQTIYRAQTNGMFGLYPFLITTQDKYYYTFPEGTYLDADGNDVPVLRTYGILSLVGPRLYGNRKAGMVNRMSFITVGDIEFMSYPGHQKDRTSSKPAEFTFENINPGDTTNVYYHYFVRAPAELVTESIPLELPEGCHLALSMGVISLLKSETYGDDNAFEYWKQKTAVEIWAEMNKGSQNRPREIRPQLKDRNYSSSNWGWNR